MKPFAWTMLWLLMLLPLVASSARVMVVCGEHAREHVTVRTCEQLVQLLADDNNNANVRVVVNANPAGAAIARTRDPCWRGNAAGVDLNRNWPSVCNHTIAVHRVFGADEMHRVHPGPFAFSEPETRALRDAIAEFRPHVLFSMHSGAQALLLLPYHCTSAVRPRNYAQQVRVLRWLRNEAAAAAMADDLHNAWIGPASRDLYPADGTLCDYATDVLRVPMCVTVEMYAGSVMHNTTTSPLLPSMCRDLFGVAAEPIPRAQREAETRWARDFLFASIRRLQAHATRVSELLLLLD